jgi:O-antigen/teichoic acid export membrane protein
LRARIAPALREHSGAIGGVMVSFFAQAVLVLTGVFLARVLGVENRGNFQLLVVIPLVLSQVGTLGLPAALTFYIARDGRHLSRALAASLAKPALALTALLVLAQAVLLVIVLRDERGAIVIAGAVTLAAIPGLVLYSFGIAIIQGQQRFVEFNILRAAQLVSYAAGLAVLLAAGASSMVLVAVVWTGSSLAAGVLVIAYALKGFARDAGTAVPPRRELAWFGLRSVLGSTSPFDAFRLDQLMVGFIAGPVALGLYVAGQSFTNLPRFIAQSIGMVAYPRVAGGAREAAPGLIAVHCAFALVACGGIVAVLELASGRLVVFFFGGEFADAASLMRILLLSALLFGIRRVLADCSRGLGRPEFGTTAEVASWLALVPLLVAFWDGGAGGIAWSMTICGAVGLAVQIALLARHVLAPARHASVREPETVALVVDAA